MAITIEWVSPACSHAYQRWNGPVPPAFGMPLPYLRPSLVSSLEYLVMPHVYVLNVAILALMAYPLVSAVVRRFNAARGALWIGASLCAIVAAWRLFLFSLAVWRPQTTITSGERYFELRPVALVSRPHSECRASEFWFPDAQ